MGAKLALILGLTKITAVFLYMISINACLPGHNRGKLFKATLVVVWLICGMFLRAQNTSPLDTAPGVNTTPSGADSSVSTSPASGKAGEESSLLSNGDFSLSTKDPNWPDNWGKAAGISWETENGKHFLRLVSQKPGQMLMAYREMNIPAGTKGIEITMRYRTAGVEHGTKSWFDARAIFHYLDDQHKNIKPEPKALVFSSKAADWTTNSERCVVPDGAVKLVLMPALFQAAAGTLDLAEIHVTAITNLSDAELLPEPKKNISKSKLATQPSTPASGKAGEESSLLSNGDFSLSTKDPNWPDNWGKAAGISWETENGKHFLRLVSQKPGQMLMAYREMNIPAGTKGIEITMRYRTAGVEHGTKSWFDARAIFHYLDDQHKNIKPEPKALVFSSKAADWTTNSERCVVPDGAVKLVLMPALFQAAAGTLDLAEIHVTAITNLSDADLHPPINTKTTPAQQAILDQEMTLPPRTKELKASGNQLVDSNGAKVWLQGVNIVPLGWAADGEGKILWSIHVAIDDWKANVIRLPVQDSFWFGKGRGEVEGNDQNAYRAIVDQAVKLAAAKGAYLILDLHRFLTPNESCVNFWKDTAVRYKNNPAVLFDIFNEPHGTSWDVWQKGGAVEIKQKNGSVQTIQGVGMQALVNAVRSTGAKNIIIAGGLDYAYDLTGILKGYALNDQNGNGIMYATHFYNWHKGWAKHFMAIAEKYPVIVGETGADIKKMNFIPAEAQDDPYTWVPDMLGFVQKNHLNWTGWSFYTSATPSMLLDMNNYTPTPFWGAFVKEALAGKQFEMKKER